MHAGPTERAQLVERLPPAPRALHLQNAVGGAAPRVEDLRREGRGLCGWVGGPRGYAVGVVARGKKYLQEGQAAQKVGGRADTAATERGGRMHAPCTLWDWLPTYTMYVGNQDRCTADGVGTPAQHVAGPLCLNHAPLGPALHNGRTTQHHTDAHLRVVPLDEVEPRLRLPHQVGHALLLHPAQREPPMAGRGLTGGTGATVTCVSLQAWPALRAAAAPPPACAQQVPFLTMRPCFE